MVDEKFLHVPTYHAHQMIRTWCNTDAAKTTDGQERQQQYRALPTIPRTLPFRPKHDIAPRQNGIIRTIRKGNNSKLHTRCCTVGWLGQRVYAPGYKRHKIMYQASYVQCYIRASFLLVSLPAKELGVTWTIHCPPETGPRRKPLQVSRRS